MGVLPSVVGASCSRGAGMLSLHSAVRGEDWNRKCVVSVWQRKGSASCNSNQGLRRIWRDGCVRRNLRVCSNSNGNGENELRNGDVSGDAEKESEEERIGKEEEKDSNSASNSGRVVVEVSPAVLKQMERVAKKSALEQNNGLSVTGMMDMLEDAIKSGADQVRGKDSNGGLSLIEQNLKKRREMFKAQGQLDGADSEKPPISLSFDVDARNDENRFDGAYFARLEELGEETLEMNTLDDFYPAFVILITDALLELGDLMKMLGDGEFFSTQAMLRASRIPVQKTASALKGFPEDSQLRTSLENILVNVQALSFYISSLFAGPDGVILNPDESLATEADLLYNMYYKYKHKETLTVPLDEKELVEQVLSQHGFTTVAKAVRCRQGLIFSGNWSKTPALARLEMQKTLDAKFEGLVAIILDKVPGTTENGVIIAHRYELLSFTLAEKGDFVLAGTLLFGVLVGSLQFDPADVGIDQVYLQGWIVALGLFAVIAGGWLARKAVATLYKVSHMVRLPFSLPVPHQGAFGTAVYYKGCLPDRTSLLDLSLSSAFASLAISGALMGASYTSWASSNSSGVVGFDGLLLVPEHLFSYSQLFSWLIHNLSVATISGEFGEDLNLVLNPLALAGVLGLHSTALGLLPVGIFDGGRIVTGIFGRDAQHIVTTVTFILVAVALAVKEPWLAFAWIVSTTPVLIDDWFQIDEATQPSLLRKVVGLGMVLGAVGAFVPTLV
uniref:Uncharacterized protein n=1 Tax=Physcomitrium patens TaxID=3218 RepID=A0A2K1IVG3_PHYPA|nr:hypothetical protein PHYPA_025207 [Physcomitrium patens]